MSSGAKDSRVIVNTDVLPGDSQGVDVTRSKLQRIHDAIVNRDMAELRVALAECELGKQFRTRHSALWDDIEKNIRRALAKLESAPN